MRHIILMRLIIAVSCVAAGAIAVIVVGGSQASSAPVSMLAKTSAYHVRVDLDRATLGRRTVTIQISGADGKPVTAADVSVRSVMKAMGMAGPSLPARQIAAGQYRATGELFGMLGNWTIIVRISEPGLAPAQEAVFTLAAVP